MGTRIQWLLAGTLAALAVIGALAVAVHRRHPAYPSHWDPRVLPIVRFVERTRGRRFRHPVAVDLLAPDRFGLLAAASRRPGDPALVAEDRSVAELRALGLVHGQVDLEGLARQLRMDNVLGLYDPVSKRISVRGSQLTPGVRVTLAHELTHALQDQEVDVEALERRSDIPSLVTRALVEGDAVVVEQAYAATLSPADADSYRKERAAAGASGPSVASGSSAISGPGGGASPLPAALAQQTLFPYLFGPTFVRALRQQGGPAAVDRALHHPPRSEADLVDPDRWFRGIAPAPVAAPRLGAGETAVGPAAPFGQVSLFEVLGARVSYQQAWAAVTGWQGDRAVVYRAHGTTCAAIAIVFVDPTRAGRFTVAARQWAATLPGASVALNGDNAELRSCDPGPSAPASPPVVPAPFDVLSLRASIIGLFLDRGVAMGPAACAADQVLSRVGPAQLIAYDNGTAPAGAATGIAEATRQSEAACAARPG